MLIGTCELDLWPLHCSDLAGRYRFFVRWHEIQIASKQGDTEVKLIIATIKPFKLEEVREALTSSRRPRHDGHGNQGLRVPIRPYRDLPRRRICRELRAKNQTGNRGLWPTAWSIKWSKPWLQDRPDRQNRRRQDLCAGRRTAPSACGPAKPTTTRSETRGTSKETISMNFQQDPSGRPGIGGIANAPAGCAHGRGGAQRASTRLPTRSLSSTHAAVP